MQFSKKLFLTAALAAGLLAAAAGQAQEAAKPAAGSDVAAKVNGVVISKAKLDFAVQQRVAAGQPNSPELQAAVRDDLINRELLAQEAKKKGLDKNPETAMQVEFAQQSVLVGAYIQDYLKNNPAGDAEMKKEYDRIKAEAGESEYKARHILLESEDEAKKMTAELKKDPKKFAKLAEKSKDTGSAKQGGELGWSPAGRYVPPFADALKKLKKGQMTEAPVQSQFGWHIIMLEDIRPIQNFPTYDQAKPQLQQQAQQGQVTKMLSDLRAKAKIE